MHVELDENERVALRVLHQLGEEPEEEEVCGLAFLIGFLRETSPAVVRAAVDELERLRPDAGLSEHPASIVPSWSACNHEPGLPVSRPRSGRGAIVWVPGHPWRRNPSP